MPSKGASRATNHSTTATIAPVAGPAVVVRQESAEAVLNETPSIQALVGEPVAAEVAPFLAEAAPATSVSVVDLEDPDVDSPEWADIYARAAERHRDERERIDRERVEAQRLWEQF